MLVYPLYPNQTLTLSHRPQARTINQTPPLEHTISTSSNQQSLFLMESSIPYSSLMPCQSKNQSEGFIPNLHASIVGTGGDQLLLLGDSNSIDCFLMTHDGPKRRVDLYGVCSSLAHWPDFDCFILSHWYDQMTFLDVSNTANIIRMAMIIGNQSWTRGLIQPP